MGKIKDITGQKFNHWTVLSFSHMNKSGSAMFLCRCDCGTVRVVAGCSIRAGASKCCGCIRPSSSAAKTHGGKNDRLYNVWNGIKDRCFNPKSKYYYRYGGRGITVCDEWRHDYPAFKDWAMKNGYDPTAPKYQCTLDRLDNDGDYSPGNCAWHNHKQQCNNTSKNHRVEFNGVSHTLTEWSEIIGVRKDTLRRRLCVYNWPVERALTEPNHHAKVS